jgi:hypothetical protein
MSKAIKIGDANISAKSNLSADYISHKETNIGTEFGMIWRLQCPVNYLLGDMVSDPKYNGRKSRLFYTSGYVDALRKFHLGHVVA